VFLYGSPVKSEIEVARREVENKVRPFEYRQLEYKKYGKKYLKKQQLSGDAIAQLAYQVRYGIIICKRRA